MGKTNLTGQPPAALTSDQIGSAYLNMGIVATTLISARDLLAHDQEAGASPVGTAARALIEKAGFFAEQAQIALGRKATLNDGDYRWWACEAEAPASEDVNRG